MQPAFFLVVEPARRAGIANRFGQSKDLRFSHARFPESGSGQTPT
jgi:hypothetical protein